MDGNSAQVGQWAFSTPRAARSANVPAEMDKTVAERGLFGGLDNFFQIQLYFIRIGFLRIPPGILSQCQADGSRSENHPRI